MKVLLVTSDREKCGIRDFGQMLMESMRIVAPDVEMEEFPYPDWYALASAYHDRGLDFDVALVNHHAALHASWQAPQVEIVKAWGKKVVAVQHDSFDSLDIMLSRGFPDFRGADALIVHEPVEGLTQGNHCPCGAWDRGSALHTSHCENGNVHYIRQGILSAEVSPAPHHQGDQATPWASTVGWPFPWKNFEMICQATRDAGWGILIMSNAATIEQCERWARINPVSEIIPQYLDRREIVQRMSGCDASIFMHTSGNSGTSGVIRLGIAARKPVISTSAKVNRQIRDLDGHAAICWADSYEQVVLELKRLTADRVYSLQKQMEVSILAGQDSWRNVARKYADIFREVLRG